MVEIAGRYARQVLYSVVAAALAAIVGLTQFGALSGALAIAAVGFAMGVMNSALSRVGAQAVSLTFVTGSLSRVGSSLALALRRAPLRDAQGPWDTHLRRALLLGRLWLGLPARRLFVRSRHAAPRRAGSLGARADPRRPGGVRSPRSRGGLSAPSGSMHLCEGRASGPCPARLSNWGSYGVVC
jgi:Protein of unknown function (DUF1275)